ncbi:DUF805 domain-containing protein [Psittacicella gerlachiana]|uniref:DUF805 domain-containing protein n=1 Tax=Psittacicella gerlachiana TaxID=2028574 RepID=A0A3A1Y5R4_9GAMM|nr:DUF805 domain-containing protein [Psittacicella gerlachiana]RIY33602.1 hypothetical protein CKF59_06300 [Psittacicella gerlachiana]
MTTRPNLNQNLLRHFLHLFTFNASERAKEFFKYTLFIGINVTLAYLILGTFVLSLATIYGYNTQLSVVATFSVAIALFIILNLAAAFRRVRDFGLPGLSIVVLFVAICALTFFFERNENPSIISNTVLLIVITFISSLLALLPTKVENNKYRNPKVFPQAEENSNQ